MLNEKRKISENILVYKYALPIILPFGLFCIILAYLPKAEEISFYDLIPAILLIGAIYFSLSKYILYGKNIFIDEDNIYISSGFKQIQTTISNIAQIEKCVSFFNSPDCIIINFKNSTEFGEKILFIPINEKIYDELDKMTPDLKMKSRNLKGL